MTDWNNFQVERGLRTKEISYEPMVYYSLLNQSKQNTSKQI